MAIIAQLAANKINTKLNIAHMCTSQSLKSASQLSKEAGSRPAGLCEFFLPVRSLYLLHKYIDNRSGSETVI